MIIDQSFSLKKKKKLNQPKLFLCPSVDVGMSILHTMRGDNIYEKYGATNCVCLGENH